MNQTIDVVVYGNPNYVQLPLMQTKTDLDYLLLSIFETNCPKNYSQSVKDELAILVEYQSNFNTLSDSTQKRFALYDKDLAKVVKNSLAITTMPHEEIDLNSLVDEIIDYTKPLLLKIKYKYNRPRPQVLANYYRASLFPKISVSADTPAFPSGHTFQMELIKETIGALYPQTYRGLSLLADDVNEQRLYYGLHFPSDIDFAKLCAQKILSSKAWTTKYRI